MQVVKNNGVLEAYSKEKFLKQIEHTFYNYEFLKQMFIVEVENKLILENATITSKDLLELYINVAKNLISEMYPEYDIIAGRLLMQKYHKKYFNIKHLGEYPKFSEWAMSGALKGVYTDKILNLDASLLEILDKALKPEKDYEITYVGVLNFFEKYLLNIDDKQELPQIGYMRVALGAYIDELIKPKFYKHLTKEQIINKVIKRYKDLSDGLYTEATPKWLSALTPKMQSASCVVINPADNTDSINKAIFDTGKYSKFGGGIGWYVGNLRCNGSKVGISGKSNGVVPFSQMLESTINAYNQMGRRKGGAIINLDWYHQDIFDVVMLNDKGGVAEQRARNLKISVIIHKLFLDRIKNDEYVALFDPKEVDLNKYKDTDSFKEAYEKYEKDPKLNKKFVKARELAIHIVTQRKKTGNIYIVFKENINGETTPFKDVIYQTNMCSEVFLPNIPTTLNKVTLSKNITNSEYKSIYEFGVGNTMLCNLASLNLFKIMQLNKEARERTIYRLLEAQDNIIEYSFYPSTDGEYGNRLFRPIGIGLTNVAQYFAHLKIKFDSDEALKETDRYMTELQRCVLKASVKLAQKRGAFDKIKETKWNDYRWVDNFVVDNEVAQAVCSYGVRFSTHWAIAPTATSSLVVGATEGTEPIKAFMSIKTTDRATIPQVAPNLRKYRAYYSLAHDIEQEWLVKLAGVRQRFMEQGQSINIYEEKTNKEKSYSIYEEIKLWELAYKSGVKSLYYFNGLKGEQEECFSCSA